MQESDEG